MKTMKHIFAVVLMAMGCSDVVRPEVGESFDTTEPVPAQDAPEADGPGGQVTEESDPSLRRPRGDCEEPSLIGEVDLENSRVGEPVITEVFGPNGCLEERWIREWDGELPVTERYEVFVDFLPRQAYVEPAPYVHEWRYDGDGNLVYEERRTDGELRFAEWTRYRHDGSVLEVERETYPSSDSFGIHREITRFDEAGRKVRHDVFHDGEPSGAQAWVYDSDGNEIEHWRGSGDDMGLQTRRTFVDGRLSRVELFNFRTGALRVETDYERRVDGTLQRTVERNHENGWLDVQTYDREERELIYIQDSDLDGDVEFRRTYAWDTSGRRTRELVEYDFDAGGTAHTVSEKTWAYDEQGRLVESVDASNWRDVPQRIRRTYDESGPGFVQVREDLHASGTVPVSEAYFLDEKRMQTRRSDADRDGQLERVIQQTWDGMRKLSMTTDSDGDGSQDSVQRWSYDAAGQLAEHVVDSDGDGVIDARTIHRR